MADLIDRDALLSIYIGQSTWFKDAENGCEVCGMSGMYPKGTFDFCSYGERRKE